MLKGNPVWDQFGYDYYDNLKKLLLCPPKDFVVARSAMYKNDGHHPADNSDYECMFAAEMIQRIKPKNLLDIGSHRKFIIGLLANSYEVTILDVRRSFIPSLNNENRIGGDAKEILMKSESFDVVISLCSLEHFGLGRYGDEFDLDGDKKAIKEMFRVLKPGGYLILTTTISANPVIYFNAHRVYNYKMIEAFQKEFTVVEEKVLNTENKKFYPFILEDISSREYDVYCGCWWKEKYE